MSIEVEKMHYELMDTPRLGACLQAKVIRKRALKGKIGWDVALRTENSNLKREIRMMKAILQSRQMRLKGF